MKIEIPEALVEYITNLLETEKNGIEFAYNRLRSNMKDERTVKSFLRRAALKRRAFEVWTSAVREALDNLENT